jgi:alpha-L-arabinofuranosidase
MAAAKIVVNPAHVVGPLNRRLFGSFVEHLGRCVYDGIYEPGHPSADPYGFRTDVMDLVRALGVTTIRYPGGNFVSGYRWEDGVGPRERRPKRLDLAWHSLETNQVGLHEIAQWSERVGTEPMLALNLGTRGVPEALDMLEYANIRADSALAGQRAANGSPDPFNVRMWCLGNEMDGPWQLGHRSAEDYGKIASQVAKAMRQMDPNLELVACGSSSRSMPTFGSWERIVLEHTYDDVDFISCHAYYQERDADRGSFLASGVDMDAFIEAVITTADSVKAVLRSERTVDISFDEWNVWYSDRFNEREKITDVNIWPYAPRLLEDQYSVIDAVVVGSLLISLLKHADRVKAACLAQLVNVIAPIMTEPGGPAWRQTTFFPFALTARLAQGTVLRLDLESPSYETSVYGSVSLIDAVATFDNHNGGVAVFLVNRSQDGATTVSIDVGSLGPVRLGESVTLADEDPKATNTLEHQERVAPAPNRSVRIEGGELTVDLPAISWTAIRLIREPLELERQPSI